MYDHITDLVYGQPWAILPAKLSVIQAFLGRRLAGERLDPDEVQAAMQSALPRGPRPQGGAVAVIPIYGTITQRASMMQAMSGGTSVEQVAQQFRAALADPGVRSIVFDIASPGGGVSGVQELAAEIYQARGRKPIAAVANSLAASAAYWLGAAAGDFAVTPSGEVGSIGVYAMHQDISKAAEMEGVKTTFISAGKYKVDGNPFEPLSDTARASMQAKVDAVYSQFVGDVARFRGVSATEVRGGFGEGDMVLAKDAVRVGMVDRIATLDEMIARLGGATSGGMRADALVEQLVASADGAPGALDGDYPEPVVVIDRERERRRFELATL
jgi:signal peptide peptidase SppA